MKLSKWSKVGFVCMAQRGQARLSGGTALFPHNTRSSLSASDVPAAAREETDRRAVRPHAAVPGGGQSLCIIPHGRPAPLRARQCQMGLSAPHTQAGQSIFASVVWICCRMRAARWTVPCSPCGSSSPSQEPCRRQPQSARGRARDHPGKSGPEPSVGCSPAGQQLQDAPLASSAS